MKRYIKKLQNYILSPKAETIDPKIQLGIDRAKPWFEVNGDKTLRLDYSILNNRSIVFDLGGFEGQWASDIYSKYLCNVYVFEPFKEYYEGIKVRFKKNPNIKVYPFALSNETKKVKLYADGDKTSEYELNPGSNYVMMQMQSFIDFCKSHKIGKIDLVKINIEGGEYDLLEGIIDHGWQKNINNIQIQFHDYAPDSEKRMKKIQNALSKTHKATYQYEFVWENWELKK